jgi:hypothetical protein
MFLPCFHRPLPIARGSVLLRKFSAVALFQNLSHLDPLFSTTSVALFLKKNVLPCFHRLLHRSRVTSSPQILSGGQRADKTEASPAGHRDTFRVLRTALGDAILSKAGNQLPNWRLSAGCRRWEETWGGRDRTIDELDSLPSWGNAGTRASPAQVFNQDLITHQYRRWDEQSQEISMVGFIKTAFPSSASSATTHS